MGFRFYRRINIAPGLSINLGKKGASVSVGPRGAKMTFGPNGTRTSVGIPGTGIRYEKRYGKMTQGGGGDWNGKSVIAAIAAGLALVAVLAYQFSRVDRHNPAPVFVMFASGIGSLFFWMLYFILGNGRAAAQAGSTTNPYTRMQMSSPRYNSYLSDLASASQALYNFCREVNRSTRCRNQLKALPGLEAVDSGDNPFSINKRLAAIVYCDLRSCFRKLGYDEGRLSGLTGVGYAMIILLLINRDFDLGRFRDVQQRGKLLSIVSDLKRTATLEVNIQDHEDEFRFALIFGALNHEPELVQRFATHLYRWASLIAKADGTVTQAESAALEAIMKMNIDGTCNGNVRVTERGSNPKGGSVNGMDNDLFADPAEEESPTRGHLVDDGPYSQDLRRAIECIIQTRKASTSHFQRHLGWGYNHSAKILDMLTERGVVNVQNGMEPRKILLSNDQLEAMMNEFGTVEDMGDAGSNHNSSAGQERSRKDYDGGLDSVMNRLDGLIGLEQVKNEVRQLTSFIEIQRKRKARGMKVAPVTYHCVFTGNPGTGKTTVARILADIFRELGVVKKGHLVETDRSGLVAEYVGQTAVKTNKVIDTALDGVLFIDEAYTLIQGGDRDYGGEAIATLLKRMEDDRDRLVVVLAGYTNEMKQFINSNPGLQSRFSRYIEFPDYTATELAKIFMINAEKNQYTCDKDVKASIVNVMEMAVQNKDKNFGNARYVRNLFEKAIQRQAVRLSTVAPITTEMLSELTLHDLGFAYEN
ncbi:MAG: DUF4236 domain-containing protein [Kiritimatiellae bacterium]|nr:DUF4236 domain-containing protein [Kiritimatiellia bacterium]